MKNFQLVRSAARDLSEILALIRSAISNTIAGGKVLITNLVFLCARLFNLHKEIRATQLGDYNINNLEKI